MTEKNYVYMTMTKTINKELSDEKIFKLVNKINKIPKKRVENTPAS